MTVPNYMRLKDETGRKISLSPDKKHFLLLKEGKGDLFLGLGPDPGIPAALSRGQTPLYLECPRFTAEMPADWKNQIPSTFREISLENVPAEAERRIWLYRPGLRLYPSFWAEVLAGVRLTPFNPPSSAKKDLILLAADKKSLLTPEIEQALSEEGMRLLSVPPKITAPDLADLLNQGKPVHFLSLNLHGIDPLGENLELLKQAGVRTSTWCVDNPAHILSKMKTRAWTGMNIFVTDHWFVPRLKKLGAQSVHHLPLAAAPKLFCPRNRQPKTDFDFLYVGRFSFPDQEKFFCGQKIDSRLLKKAAGLLKENKRPDFSWWAEEIKADLWPGNSIRRAGLGAEICTRMWRETILTHLAAQRDLTLVGDRGWEGLGLRARLLPPVDYYSGLPDMYASANFTLNLNNFLLPGGLTQRHFDVWLAGGFLLTDRTPGLDIFPPEMVREISFDSPQSLDRLANSLESDPALKNDLAVAWHREIKTKHTYGHRMRSILQKAD